MLDLGLLLSMIAAVALPVVFTRRWPLRSVDGRTLLDVTLAPLVVGLLVGRVVSLALDDQRSLTRLRDFMIIRSGVEFWAAIVAGMALIAIRARKERVGALIRLADIAPAALVGQAGYHLACFVRDGCYGPLWFLGPTPKGLRHGMVPIEAIAAVALVGVAILMANNALRPALATTVAIGAVAAERAVTSFWLPHVGGGLTRQHTTSLVIAVIAAAVAAPLWLVDRGHALRREVAA